MLLILFATFVLCDNLYLTKLHVLLYSVHTALKLRARCIHIGNHTTNVTDDGGKDEDTNEIVD